MKPLFLILLAVSPCCVPAQQKILPQQVAIGFNFSPGCSFRSLINNDGSPSADLVIKSRDNAEMAKFGYTTGITVAFSRSTSFWFETGLQFSNKGYKTKSLATTYPAPDGSLPVSVRITYSYHYLGIPLKATFLFGRNKLRFTAGAELTVNYLVNSTQSSLYEYADGSTKRKKTGSNYNYKKVDLSPVISAGLHYRLTNKIYLYAEPTFRYGLLKTIDAPVSERLWNAGINTGIFYRLR